MNTEETASHFPTQKCALTPQFCCQQKEQVHTHHNEKKTCPRRKHHRRLLYHNYSWSHTYKAYTYTPIIPPPYYKVNRLTHTPLAECPEKENQQE